MSGFGSASASASGSASASASASAVITPTNNRWLSTSLTPHTKAVVDVLFAVYPDKAKVLIKQFIKMAKSHNDRIKEHTQNLVDVFVLEGDQAVSAYKMLRVYSIVGKHRSHVPTTEEAGYDIVVARVELFKRLLGFSRQEEVTAELMLMDCTEGGDVGLEFDMCKSLTSITALEWQDPAVQEWHLHIATWQVSKPQ